MSPIADLTVLTRVSTRCDYNSHLKTCAVRRLVINYNIITIPLYLSSYTC